MEEYSQVVMSVVLLQEDGYSIEEGTAVLLEHKIMIEQILGIIFCRINRPTLEHQRN